jgi:hypothetical protein
MWRASKGAQAAIRGFGASIEITCFTRWNGPRERGRIRDESLKSDRSFWLRLLRASHVDNSWVSVECREANRATGRRKRRKSGANQILDALAVCLYSVWCQPVWKRTVYGVRVTEQLTESMQPLKKGNVAWSAPAHAANADHVRYPSRTEAEDADCRLSGRPRMPGRADRGTAVQARPETWGACRGRATGESPTPTASSG